MWIHVIQKMFVMCSVFFLGICGCFLVVVVVVVVVFSSWASLGRNQSPVRRPVWLWYAASWASS